MQRIDTPDEQFHAGDPSTGALGTIVTAAYMQSLQEEIAGAVETAGLTLDPDDNTQLAKAIRAMVSRTTPLTDRGTLNAYAAVNVVPLTAQTLVHGVRQRVTIGTTNGGASTYSPDGLPPKPILGLDLMPLEGLELLATQVAELEYVVAAAVNGGNGAWLLLRCAGGAMQLPAYSYGVTPPQFDKSNRLATMEAVQLVLGNDSPSFWSSVAVSQTIAPSKAGGFVNVTAAGTTQTIGITGLPPGARFTFAANYTTGAGTTITSDGGAGVLFNAPGFSNTASFTINPGEIVKVVYTANGFMIDGGSALGRMTPGMTLYVGAAPYQRFPSGLILQWGSTTVSTAGSGVVVTLPITFPNSLLLNPFVTGASNGGFAYSNNAGNASQIVVNSTVGGNTVSWFAVGH